VDNIFFNVFKICFIIYTIILLAVCGVIYYFKFTEEYESMSDKFKTVIIIMVFIWFAVLFALMEFHK